MKISLMLAVGLLAFVAGSIATAAQAPAPGTAFQDCTHCPQMVVIPPGQFVMGSPKEEPGRFDNEGPQHLVTIARPFAMATVNVTVAEFRRFATETRRRPSAGCRIFDGVKTLVRLQGHNWTRPGFAQTDRDPVVCITWNDAQDYIDWLNKQAGRSAAASGTGHYRLPTEAEWEYAARAGSKTKFYWGEDIRRDRVNYGPDEPRFAPVAKGADRWRYTSPSGAFPANPFGLFDMAGNIWQLTQDCWSATYEGAAADGSARVSGACDERVVRGGSWLKPPAGERSAKRGQGKVEDLKGNHEIGFRVVRDLDAEAGQ